MEHPLFNPCKIQFSPKWPWKTDIDCHRKRREGEREREQVSLVAAFIKIDWLRPRDSISNTRYIKGIESRESRANIMKLKEKGERKRGKRRKNCVHPSHGWRWCLQGAGLTRFTDKRERGYMLCAMCAACIINTPTSSFVQFGRVGFVYFIWYDADLLTLTGTELLYIESGTYRHVKFI